MIAGISNNLNFPRSGLVVSLDPRSFKPQLNRIGNLKVPIQFRLKPVSNHVSYLRFRYARSPPRHPHVVFENLFLGISGPRSVVLIPFDTQLTQLRLD
jgi:hypothetical protein